jgi:hypothetical protein
MKALFIFLMAFSIGCSREARLNADGTIQVPPEKTAKLDRDYALRLQSQVDQLRAELQETETRMGEANRSLWKTCDEQWSRRSLTPGTEISHVIFGDTAKAVWTEFTKDCPPQAEHGCPSKPQTQTIKVNEKADVICLDFPDYDGSGKPFKRCFDIESASGA